ncbi:MAG: PIN domain-containing protein [Deltaproteobacteria bacterium]|nr:PIN domain-containing protein [Deltaproteobacteria bacterium]
MPDKVLVDTSVWIEFFRKKDSSVSQKLREYLKLNQACYTGPIAIELYQGAKTNKEIEVIDHLLQTIHYVEITRTHYQHAGEVSHHAARSGKIFSIVDLILAVLAHDEQLRLFSLDVHFKEISQFCPLQLETP